MLIDNWVPVLTLLVQITLFVVILSLVFRTHPVVLGLRLADQVWRAERHRAAYLPLEQEDHAAVVRCTFTVRAGGTEPRRWRRLISYPPG